MNYLAHAQLSFNNTSVLTGNMISDFVKGRAQYNYPLSIQTGIQLHRQIDAFTDGHAVTREMKEYFKASYRLYAGAFCDVVYDHFLANDINEFENEMALQNFTQFVYTCLEKDELLLPEPFKKMLPYMQSQNWLYNYRNLWGMEKSFGGLVRRSKYLTDSTAAFEIFQTNYTTFQQLYTVFFPEIKSFAAHQLQELLNA
jgi:acyl carrier protein phosphodiesterase